MEIATAKFIKGIRGTDDIATDPKPKIAFIGRSNVGKSSLINSLTRKKDLVKSSSLPGKTREINFFLIKKDSDDKGLFFVDLPGYGFAKMAMTQREKLRKLILWYLFSGEVKNDLVVLIVDFKVGPSKFDFEMIELLRENKIKFIIVANKADKIGKGARIKHLKKMKEELGNEEFVLYSAKTGEGRNELLNKIFNNSNF